MFRRFLASTVRRNKRDVEIKAKVRKLDELLKNAERLSGSKGTLIPQFDTFYNVPNGRLKLRVFQEGNAELIYYNRPNAAGPKLSSYEKYDAESQGVDNLNSVLTQALGVSGAVKKTRQLFLVGQTRIHVDCVEGLGNFMELEVVLKDDESAEHGKKIAYDLMAELGVDEDDLLPCAYTDLLKE